MITVNELRKTFGGKQVLRGVNLKVDKGQTVSVIGRSGCGKSTLLRHIMGLTQPDSGTIEVADIEITRAGVEEMAEVRERMGVVFQYAALLNSLTVSENIGLPLREHTEMAEDDIREKVRDCLKKVFLDPDIEDEMPSALSGGMRKRVGLARAIIRDPEVVLYDEPTTGLDPITSTGIHQLIQKLADELGVTSLVITHDMEGAMMVSDRINMLNEGTVVAEGAPAEIRDSDDPALRQFLEGRVDGPLTGED